MIVAFDDRRTELLMLAAKYKSLTDGDLSKCVFLQVLGCRATS